MFSSPKTATQPPAPIGSTLRAALAPLIGAAALGLAGCASQPTDPPAEAATQAGTEAGWHAVPLPGKAATRYTQTRKDGRGALKAEADASASMWRLKIQVPPEAIAQIRFAWWVSALPPAASVACTVNA